MARAKEPSVFVTVSVYAPGLSEGVVQHSDCGEATTTDVLCAQGAKKCSDFELADGAP